MSAWKRRLVAGTLVFLCVSFVGFVVAGYTALYWAWVRHNLDAARLYLPWARNFGLLAVTGAAVAFGILFSSKTFPVPARMRLWMSLLATLTIAFFAEFRNEGKFCFKGLHHFFLPGTWIHDGLNRIVPSLGDFLYRVEYSHWNDFLLGPAVVSLLFPLGVARIYKAQQNSMSWNAPGWDDSERVEQALRFARILMNVGLFWFFWQAWAEKAGYLSNPHSGDEIDLPFEFGGTMLGFWMARILTKPFGERSEKFRSTFVIDFVSSGVIGLLYTLIVGPLVEGVAGAVGHSLYPVVPGALDVHQYSALERHMRPLELLLIAGATWWALNRSSGLRSEEMTRLGGVYEDAAAEPKWAALKAMVMAFGMLTVYLAVLAIMFTLLEPQGVGWTLATAATGLATGTAAFLLVRWVGREGVMRLLDKKEIDASGPR